MGLNDSFQLCSLVFGFLKLFYLTLGLYQIVYCDNGWTCRDTNSIPAIFLILLSMIFPTMMITGIFRKNLQLLRICKIFNIIEKSAIIFTTLVTLIMMNSAYRSDVRWHLGTEKDAMSVEMSYLVFGITILLASLYMIFRNWMINGTIESVKRDLYSLNRDKYVMQYNNGP